MSNLDYAPYDLARRISYPLWFTRILNRDVFMMVVQTRPCKYVLPWHKPDDTRWQ